MDATPDPGRPFPATPPPLRAPPPLPSGLATPAPARFPGLWAALGMIGLYFLLQLGLSIVFGFAIGLYEGIRHVGEPSQIRERVVSAMQQPNARALMVVIIVPLAALIVLTLARRIWPRLWAMASPPGFGMCRPSLPSLYAAAVAIGLLMPPLGGLLTQWLAHGHPVTQNVAQIDRSASPVLQLVLSLVVVTAGPVVEELLFRGVLLSALLRRLPTGWAVAACALLFGAVHLPGLDYRWYALPDLMLLAVALCWLRLKSGSLWPSMVAHACNNSVAMLALFVAVAQHHA